MSLFSQLLAGLNWPTMTIGTGIHASTMQPSQFPNAAQLQSITYQATACSTASPSPPGPTGSLRPADLMQHWADLLTPGLYQLLLSGNYINLPDNIHLKSSPSSDAVWLFVGDEVCGQIISRHEVENMIPTPIGERMRNILAPYLVKINNELKAGEIIGWRAWSVVADSLDGQRLKSCYVNVQWAPDTVMIANNCICPVEQRIPTKPSPYGDFGIYAWREREDAVKYVGDSAAHVLGQVELWGEVIEHEAGYRAEFAKIISLDWASKDIWPWQLKKLQDLYCPKGESK